jgi:tetratricopeptide (TPR) repeat protein
MKKLSFLLLLMVFWGFQQLVAQPMTIDKLAAAEKELANKEYYTALEWYLDAYEDGEDNIQDDVDVIHNIAMLYSELRNYRKAASWYRKLSKIDKNNKYPNAMFHLGYAEKINGKYDSALEALNEFMAASGDEEMKKKAQIEIDGITLAQSLPEADPEIIVENKSTRNFSSAYTEWSPFYASETEVYYSSMNSDELVYRDGDYHKKIYKSTKTDDDWSAGTVLGEAINKKGVHNGSLTMSDDGNYIYFSRAVKEGESLKSSKIYVAERTGGSWGEAKEVEGLNGDSYLTTQPSFGKVNGKDAIFFTSNMPGGKGGYDLCSGA